MKIAMNIVFELKIKQNKIFAFTYCTNNYNKIT